ncbi:MAG: alpha-amylase family glycosyl hydrolase, partial [Ruthenibacterium sp.]
MRKNDRWRQIDNGAVLNAYPDSMGGTLGDIVALLQKSEFENAFHSFYILPSLFHSDLDRGFSVIDYQLNTLLATEKDLENLRKCGISLKLDFVLNHLSVQSPQFQNLLLNGEASPYKDFFIEWNKFWNNYGVMTDEGYIQPYPSLIENMFFRKPGLPILMVHMPNGENVPYWNTFYQKVSSDSNKKQYLGQMDLNIKSPLVWDFYKNTLQTLAGYGADIVRLDAFAYAPKEPGKHNFLNIPDTWDLLERVRKIADGYEVNLLPEIHASYAEKIYLQLAQKGYMTYDFFLPGLILDAFERKQGALLISWAQEQRKNGIHVINMLGCHDGIPLLDLKGLVPDAQIEKLIDTVVKRGGYVKNLHGQKNIYYQVNATYYSALGENDRKMLLARAIQLFM